jgi:hypothetical protein
VGKWWLGEPPWTILTTGKWLHYHFTLYSIFLQGLRHSSLCVSFPTSSHRYIFACSFLLGLVVSYISSFLCQLGKLPSSRISTDILALRAQNLQQLSASPDQKSQSRTLCSLLTASQQSTKYHRLTANTTVHRKSLLTAKRRISAHGKTQPSTTSIPSPPVEWCAHPPLLVPYSSLPTHALTPSTTPRPPSFVMS